MIHMPASLRPLARLSAPSRCWTRVAGLKRPLVQDRLSERCFRYYSAPSRQHFKIQGLQVPSDKLAEQLTTHTSPPFTTNTEAWEWIPPAKKSPLVTDDGFGGGDSAIEEVPNLRGEFLTVEEIVQVVKNNRGSDIEWVDLEGKTTAAKFMVIATAKSYRHVHKIAREILAEHKRRGVAVTRPREQGKSPSKSNDWICVDLGQILVNILVAEAREDLLLEEVFKGEAAAIAE